MVVSVEHAVAAPFATRQLSDLGARVIKIERVGRGDFAREYDDVVFGMSSNFAWLNRSKESVCLDLKDEQGISVLRRLVGAADVFVHNLAPGSAERLGLGADDLRTDHQDLVCCAISGYGSGGPYDGKKAYDLLIQCEAGLLSVTGTAEEPAKAGIPIADIAAGMYAYSSILAALILRERTGAGSSIEISMLEALAEWMGYPVYYTMYAGIQPSRTGASHPLIAPYGPFRCSDDVSIFLAVQNEREWQHFCEIVLADPTLVDHELYATNVLRVQNVTTLRALIQNVVAKMDATQLMDRLDTAGVAYGRLRDVQELIDHPQLAARHRWTEIDSPVGPLRALWPPGQRNDADVRFGPVPWLGQHTDAVLREFDLKQLT